MTFCDNPKCCHHVEVPDSITILSFQVVGRVGFHRYRLPDGSWLQLCDQCKTAIDFMDDSKTMATARYVQRREATP